MSNCSQCGAWYHFANDESGFPVPGGVWILCVTAPCDAFYFGGLQGWFQPDGSGKEFPFSGSLGYCLFDGGIGSARESLEQFYEELDPVDYPGILTDIQQLAQALLSTENSILTLRQGLADAFWIGCADQPPSGITCPPGYQYDPQTESCQPIFSLIPPIPPLPPQCPPGTTWDPSTETCKPTTIPPPPIPPGTPPPPLPPPEFEQMDEIDRCCVQTNANLVLIQQELQQLKLSITGQPLDPVTCTQLTGLIYTVNFVLLQIVKAIAAASSAPAPPVDLTPIVNALKVISDAIANIQPAPVEEPVDLSHLNAQADSQVAARDETTATLKAVDLDVQAKILQFGVQL
jgi:hypothetical protein